MRILSAGTAQSPVQREELPGIVRKRRSVTVAATLVAALSLCGPALAKTSPMPDGIHSGAGGPQSVATPERISDASAPAASKPADAQPVVAPAAAVAPTVSSDDGLGALVTVLISVSGALALAGVAYTAARVTHHRHGHGHGHVAG